MAANEEDFGSDAVIHKTWLFLNAQCKVFDEARLVALKQPDEPWATLIPVFWAITESSGSFSMLARAGRVRDCYIVCRSVYETIVNAAFIIAGGKPTAERARRHALQKIYRDGNRRLEVADMAFVVKRTQEIDLADHPEIQQALDEFTSKKGREITSWTPESVEQKLVIINDKYGADVTKGLMSGLIGIYRHASEVVHGTVFGAMHTLGMADFGKHPDSMEKVDAARRQFLCLLLLMAGISIGSLIIVISCELDLPELVARSKDNIKEVASDEWARGGTEDRQNGDGIQKDA